MPGRQHQPRQAARIRSHSQNIDHKCSGFCEPFHLSSSSAYSSNTTVTQHTPAICQKGNTLICRNSFGIVNVLPWQLRKCRPVRKGAAFPLSESILLRIGRIPDPVDKQVRDVKKT